MFSEKILEAIRERNYYQTDAIAPLYNAYAELRRVPKSPLLPSADEDATFKRLENDVRAKTRQIEGQQSLLTDLQAQLSLKEKELSEMHVKHTTAQREITALQSELIRVNSLYLEKCSEIEKMNAKPVPDLPPPPQLVSSLPAGVRSCVPRKTSRTLGLNLGASPPCRLAGIRGSLGPRLLAVGSKRVQVIDRANSHLVADFQLGSNAVALGLGVAPDGGHVLAGTTEGQLLLLEISSQSVRAELRGCSGKVKSCDYVGDSTKCFSASTDRCLRLWDLTKSGIITKTFTTSSQIVDACSTDDGSLIATAHQNGKIILWSPNAANRIAEIDAHADSCIGLDISRCGKFLTSLGRDDKISIFNLSSYAEPLHKIGAPGFSTFQDSSFPCISPDARIVSACGASDGGVWCFDVISGKHLGTVNTGDAVCVFWGASAVAGGAESFEMLSGHRNGNLKWWPASENNK